jgi:hypothetical protein
MLQLLARPRFEQSQVVPELFESHILAKKFKFGGTMGGLLAILDL